MLSQNQTYLFFLTYLTSQVVGKFSIRLVPDQNPRLVAERVKCYLQEVHASRCSGNSLRIKAFRDGRPFIADQSSLNYQAAYDALLYVWEKPPDLTREGATISMAAVLEVGPRLLSVRRVKGPSTHYVAHQHYSILGRKTLYIY